MDKKKMLQDGFQKKMVAIIITKDSHGKEHYTVIDTPEHARMYKDSEDMRLATMYVKEN